MEIALIWTSGAARGRQKKFAAAAAKGRHHHWLQRLATGREEKQRCGNEKELLFDKLPVREPTPKRKYSPVPESGNSSSRGKLVGQVISCRIVDKDLGLMK